MNLILQTERRLVLTLWQQTARQALQQSLPVATTSFSGTSSSSACIDDEDSYTTPQATRIKRSRFGIECGAKTQIKFPRKKG